MHSLLLALLALALLFSAGRERDGGGEVLVVVDVIEPQCEAALFISDDADGHNVAGGEEQVGAVVGVAADVLLVNGTDVGGVYGEVGGLAVDRNEAFEAADDYETKVVLQGEVRDLALITDVLLFTGGAVALSGLVMGIVGMSQSDGDEPHVRVIAAPGLAGVAVDARF